MDPMGNVRLKKKPMFSKNMTTHSTLEIQTPKLRRCHLDLPNIPKIPNLRRYSYESLGLNKMPFVCSNVFFVSKKKSLRKNNGFNGTQNKFGVLFCLADFDQTLPLA